MKNLSVILCITIIVSVSAGKMNFDNLAFEGAHPIGGWAGQESKLGRNIYLFHFVQVKK